MPTLIRVSSNADLARPFYCQPERNMMGKHSRNEDREDAFEVIGAVERLEDDDSSKPEDDS